MTPAARQNMTLELLHEIHHIPKPADAQMSAFFRARRFIGAKDRAEIATRAYALLRHFWRLGALLQSVKVEDTVRHRWLAWWRVGEQRSAAEIAALCSGGQYAPEKLSYKEQELLTKLEGADLNNPAFGPAILGECAPDFYEKLSAAYGSQLPALLDALNQPAALDLRVNTLKLSRDEALALLQAQGYPITATPFSPVGLRLTDRTNLGNIELFQNGALEVQDEGSQLVGLLVGASSGMRVADFCAGAGGKSLSMAATMNNKGTLVACDVLSGRLQKAKLRFRKAGAHNISVQPLTSENDAWVKRHKASFDRVLVDAPCSGSGTWRRNPDARMRALGPGLTELLPLQARILASAARMVKNGGRLIYATCSLLPEENQQQIEAFLATHPDFVRVPVAELWPQLVGTDLPQDTESDLRLNPAQHGTDGFYACVLQKVMPEKATPEKPAEEPAAS